MKLAYRQPDEADDETLFLIYASTRIDEVSRFGWASEQQEAFLRMQYEQRRSAYKLQFPLAETHLIIADDEIAGSLIVEWKPAVAHLVDIAILAPARGKGIGSSVIRELQTRSTALGTSIELHVDRFNTDALRFYIANGFQMTGESQISYMLRWDENK